jgi:hypothetical protein
MPTFEFLNRAVPYNVETEIGFLNNGTVGPYFAFSNLYILSPTGCQYFLIRVYKNSILLNSFGPPTFSLFTSLIDENKNIQLEPGSNLSITALNLDPSQATEAFEGSLQ